MPQDKLLEISGHLLLSRSWVQLRPVPNGLRVQTDQRFVSFRVDPQSGQARRNIATPSRYLLFIYQEQKHHQRPIPVNCQQVWEDNEMSTFKDFLVWYNNLVVVPFLKVVEKMSQFWKERKINIFKDSILVPCLTLEYLFSFLGDQIYFSLFDEAISDLYHLIQDNNTGSLSILFHRYHEARKTKIKEADQGEDAKLCGKIMGYDTNVLYLWALMRDRPTGTKRFYEDGDRMAGIHVCRVQRKHSVKQHREAYQRSQTTHGRFQCAEANCISIPQVLLAWSQLFAQLRKRI